MPPRIRHAVNPEELFRARAITARRAVEAELDPLRDPNEKLKTFGDFLLCSAIGLDRQRLRTSKRNFESSIQSGHIPQPDLEGYITSTLLGLGNSLKDAARVGALTADPTISGKVARLSYFPASTEVPGIIRRPGELDFDEAEFVRGIIASAEQTTS